MDCVNVQIAIKLGKREPELIVLGADAFIQVGACQKHFNMLRSLFYSEGGLKAAQDIQAHENLAALSRWSAEKEDVLADREPHPIYTAAGILHLFHSMIGGFSYLETHTDEDFNRLWDYTMELMKADPKFVRQHDADSREAVEKKVVEIVDAHAWVENTLNRDQITVIRSENFENLQDALVDYILSLKGEDDAEE